MKKKIHQNLIKNLLFILSIVFFSTSVTAQMSYEEYKEKYIPHYIKLAPKNNGVKMANGYTPKELAGAIEVFVEEDEKENIATILSSCNRDHIGKTLDLMGPSYAKKALQMLKNEWQLELMWFVSKETYHKLAPELVPLIIFTGSKLGHFGKSVDPFNFAYAGAGYSTAWSNLKGINNWTSNQPGMAEFHWFRGFHATAGLKLKKDNYIDFDYEFKGVKGSSGKEADENLNRDIRFRNNTISVTYMNHTPGKIVSYSSGVGLHYTMGNLAWTNTGSQWTKLENFNNFGVNLKAQLFINPFDKLPVMLGAGAYWNINLRKHDFSILNETFSTGSFVPQVMTVLVICLYPSQLDIIKQRIINIRGFMKVSLRMRSITFLLILYTTH